jgi:predicted transcriptional regulator
MKTTTVRLDDIWADMVDYVAKRDNCRPSDVLREAVRFYMLDAATKDSDLAKLKDTALNATLAETEARVLEQFGEQSDRHTQSHSS